MNKRNPKAEGMTWLSPYIIVKDVKGALAFYEKAFGFTTGLTLPDKEGGIMHAEMKYKDTTIMIGPECDQKAPSTLKGSPVSFYIYVDDVEAQFKRAKEAGATVAAELTDQFWGDRTCAFACPEGHKWSFAQNVADFDPSKAPQ